MVRTEEHAVKKRKRTRELYRKIDGFCYQTKNLYNSVNYKIKQCHRISRKMADGKELEEWEEEMVTEINEAIHQYALVSSGKKKPLPIGPENGWIVDAYFLSWYMKTKDVYREMPYATCAQICIQELCRNWKSYFKGSEEWEKHPGRFFGRPKKPNYLDKADGRGHLVLTGQKVSVDERGRLRFPKFLNGLRVQVRHRKIRQVRIVTETDRIRIFVQYEEEQKTLCPGAGVMGIDPGVNNLMALCMNTEAAPILISGRPLKSMNQYYNKQRAQLQASVRKIHRKNTTLRLRALTEKRNRKIHDYMHKASRKVIEIAQENGIGTIVIGRSKGWKQGISEREGSIDEKRRTNQNFVNIPYRKLIEMIRYKAEAIGIRVIEQNEAYTSGTSYLDQEPAEKEYYNKKRRICRGLFRSNAGILINADVNAAYQILRKAGYGNKVCSYAEAVRTIQVT